MTEEHVLDPRAAGLVRRYHTWPVLTNQSVAEHTWQVMRILWAIWPGVPRHVLQHTMTHDLGERRKGDPPYPSKKEMSPAAREEWARAEHAAILSMCQPWGLPAPPPLTEPERLAFKLAEYIEMWEFGLYEVNLGNRYATLICERCIQAWQPMVNTPEALPDGVAREAGAYTQKRRQQEEDIHSEQERHGPHGPPGGHGHG